MIFVDDRVGSIDLVKPLQDSGLPVTQTRLHFADVAFTGKGPEHSTLEIGIELKKLNDLVGSLRSGRLSGHQLPGLRQAYDRVWLLIEGIWRHDDQGFVTTYQGPQRGWRPVPGRMTANELEKQVLTLELCGGMHVRYTNSRRDTVRALSTLYRWWTDKPFESHSSHLAVHDVPMFMAINAFRAAVMKWPEIGLKASLAVDAHFKGNIRRAACAPVDEWAAIQTVDQQGKLRRLGHPAAVKVVSFLQGEST